MDNLSNIDVPILDTKYLVNVFSTLIQSWIGNCVIPVKYNISIPYLKELELSKIGITIIRSKTYITASFYFVIVYLLIKFIFKFQFKFIRHNLLRYYPTPAYFILEFPNKIF